MADNWHRLCSYRGRREPFAPMNLFGGGAHQGRNLMSIRLAVSYAAAGALAVGFAAVSAGEAKAQANVLKECGTQYQAAKAANELKGQSWQDFLKACRARLAEQPAPTEAPAAAAPPAPEPPPAAAAPTPAPAPAPTVAAPPPAPAPAPTPAVTAPPPAPAPAPAPTVAAPPPAAAPAPAAAPKAAAPAKPAGESKAAQQSRQKKCGAEWKAKKAELQKANPKLKWPQYWSDCNKRLKAAGE